MDVGRRGTSSELFHFQMAVEVNDSLHVLFDGTFNHMISHVVGLSVKGKLAQGSGVMGPSSSG